MARRRKRPITLAQVSDLTPERRAHAGSMLQWPADKRSPQQTARVIDHLERLHDREQISDRAYAAGMRFRAHHQGAGMLGHMGTLDLHRILSSPVDRGREHQFHVNQYGKALLKLGLIRLGVLEAVVCYDKPLEQVAVELGRGAGGRGVEAVRRQLAGALDELATLWGL